jgi:hypothetical protein
LNGTNERLCTRIAIVNGWMTPLRSQYRQFENLRDLNRAVQLLRGDSPPSDTGGAAYDPMMVLRDGRALQLWNQSHEEHPRVAPRPRGGVESGRYADVADELTVELDDAYRECLITRRTRLKLSVGADADAEFLRDSDPADTSDDDDEDLRVGRTAVPKAISRFKRLLSPT